MSMEIQKRRTEDDTNILKFLAWEKSLSLRDKELKEKNLGVHVKPAYFEVDPMVSVRCSGNCCGIGAYKKEQSSR